MKIFTTITETKDWLINVRNEAESIGFVPTMGALHRGHISLLERAKRENDIAVASIFVNPLQFNDKKDLQKYPRTLEEDIEKLIQSRCDMLFSPSVEEMYPPPLSNSPQRGEDMEVMLNKLFPPSGGFRGGEVMEGAHRPGHFQGVCLVVKKLFDIIEPAKAYFGEKDFQQLAIIKHMVKILQMPVVIIPCPTVREAEGLAMSSRNALLNSDERKNTSHIYKTLQGARDKERGTIQELKKWVSYKINENPFLQLEYFEIVNSETLIPIQDWKESKNLQACIAVKVGTVRLIDNIAF